MPAEVALLQAAHEDCSHTGGRRAVIRAMKEVGPTSKLEFFLRLTGLLLDSIGCIGRFASHRKNLEQHRPRCRLDSSTL